MRRRLEAVSDDHAAGGLAHLAPAPLGALARRRVRGAHRSDLSVSVEDGDRRGDVGLVGELVGTVAGAAVQAPHEEHPGVDPGRGQDAGVVAGARRDLGDRDPEPASRGPDRSGGRGPTARPARSASRGRHRRRTGCRPATSAAAAGTAATSASSASTLGARTSTVARTRPGMTFAAGPATVTSPIVATAPGISRARSRRRTASSAHAEKASLRSSIGTVPAWPDAPRKVTREAGHPDDRGDVAEGRAGRVEDRALLDVRLDVRRRAAPRRPDGPASPSAASASAAETPAESRSARSSGPTPARDAAAAEAPMAEPPALLVAEGDDGQRGRRAGRRPPRPRPRAPRRRRAHRRSGRRRDRVEVGAGPDLGAPPRRRPAARRGCRRRRARRPSRPPRTTRRRAAWASSSAALRPGRVMPPSSPTAPIRRGGRASPSPAPHAGCWWSAACGVFDRLAPS